MPAAPAVTGTPVTALDASSSATTLIFTKDPSTVVGEVLLASMAIRTSNGTFTPPAGWATIYNATTASSISLAIFQRIVDGTEGSTISFTSSTAGRLAGGLIRIAGADLSTPVDVKSAATGTSTTTLTATGVTPAALNTNGLLLGFWSLSSGLASITVPAGMAQLWSFVASAATAAPSVAAASLTLVSSAATGNKVATGSSALNFAAQLVLIQPPQSADEDIGWGMVAL